MLHFQYEILLIYYIFTHLRDGLVVSAMLPSDMIVAGLIPTWTQHYCVLMCLLVSYLDVSMFNVVSVV